MLPFSLVARAGLAEEDGMLWSGIATKVTMSDGESAILDLDAFDHLWRHYGHQRPYVFSTFLVDDSNSFDAALAGWGADYVSGRNSFLAGLGLLFASMALFCVARDPWLLFVSRGSQGLASTLIYTSGLALIAHTVSAEDVGSWYDHIPDEAPRCTPLISSTGWASC